MNSTAHRIFILAMLVLTFMCGAISLVIAGERDVHTNSLWPIQGILYYDWGNDGLDGYHDVFFRRDHTIIDVDLEANVGIWNMNKKSGQVTMDIKVGCKPLFTGYFISPELARGTMKCREGSNESGSWKADIDTNNLASSQ